MRLSDALTLQIHPHYLPEDPKNEAMIWGEAVDINE
jgi:hypothetical protein